LLPCVTKITSARIVLAGRIVVELHPNIVKQAEFLGHLPPRHLGRSTEVHPSAGVGVAFQVLLRSYLARSSQCWLVPSRTASPKGREDDWPPKKVFHR
jgi:hypothetical protein